jgi:hypothetical protein
MAERAAKGCGLWELRDARVVHVLSLERFNDSLLPASVSALQASPRTSNCGGSYVPTARGAVIEAMGAAEATKRLSLLTMKSLFHR